MILICADFHSARCEEENASPLFHCNLSTRDTKSLKSESEHDCRVSLHLVEKVAAADTVP